MHGKRDFVARGLIWSGVAFVLNLLPQQDLLLVLNYHRIGNRDEDLFDPGVFSATAEEFDRQLAYIRRHATLVALDEALAFVSGKIPAGKPRTRVLITFDDGYLDNYELAFPILRSHGAQGVFFLATGMVGSCHVPWWDEVAYLMKTARRRRFTLTYPAESVIDMARDGIDSSLRRVLALHKRPANGNHERFLNELADHCAGRRPPCAQRRFLDWNEAREMLAGGMAIGSHTHSHHVLSQLGIDAQREELTRSRELLAAQGLPAETLAYPVGRESSFSAETQEAARQAGYRGAFSFFGGTNRRAAADAFNIRRVGVGHQSWTRFRAQAAVCRASGTYWP
jgi:peptidoglycan/xylan/chitin deacetylase (PgdA/CDA1 family)